MKRPFLGGAGLSHQDSSTGCLCRNRDLPVAAEGQPPEGRDQGPRPRARLRPRPLLDCGPELEAPEQSSPALACTGDGGAGGSPRPAPSAPERSPGPGEHLPPCGGPGEPILGGATARATVFRRPKGSLIEGAKALAGMPRRALASAASPPGSPTGYRGSPEPPARVVKPPGPARRRTLYDAVPITVTLKPVADSVTVRDRTTRRSAG